MLENQKIYEQKKYFALALDPIHIGTGGYRIGRVDNTIVREPATGLPKIPGTTIEGVCRSYAFLRAKENNENVKIECAKGKPKDDKEPCGSCSICITFGYTTKNKSLQAMALFSDAKILFFPVATMVGPVWVTCPMVLKDAEIKEYISNSEKNIPEPEESKFIVPDWSSKEKSIVTFSWKKLNFGWLLLEQDRSNNKKTYISNWKYKENNSLKSLKVIPKDILKRIVIVSDSLFAQIVNSNLEVRTSVAIDPERGAAEERALFTYEAIPRGTIFWFDVIYQNPKNFPILNGLKLKWKDKEIEIKENTKDDDLFSLLKSCVWDGLSLFEYLGVGGMSSRGFGKLKVL